MGNTCTSTFYKYHTTSIFESEQLNELLKRKNLAEEYHDIFLYETMLETPEFRHNLKILLSSVLHFELFIVVPKPGPVSKTTKAAIREFTFYANGNVYLRRINERTNESYDSICTH